MVNIKNILFDFGGVMLPEGNINLKPQLKKIFSVDNEMVLGEIFDSIRSDFRDGLINEKQRICFFLSKLNIKSYNKEELIKLWDGMLNNYKDYNYKLEEYIITLKKFGYNCILLSDTYPPLRDRLQNKGFYKAFDNIILSCDIHISKKDTLTGLKNIFLYLPKIGINYYNSVLIDDRTENCIIAKENKFKAIHYTGFLQLKKDLKKLIRNISSFY